MPYHPPLKIAAEERFFPKNSHWEKMKYMLKTVVIGLFSIDFVFLPPRQYPDSPRHHLDTQQTPHRHPADTPKLPLLPSVLGLGKDDFSAGSNYSNYFC